MVRRRYKVYLAGPVSNCNDDQLHTWREEVVARWSHEFDLIDPTKLIGASAGPFEVVHGDLTAIQGSDAVLCNMWKESIGTAIGVAHAARHGKPVVVADPNLINSRVLAFFAQAVVRTPHEGLRRIRESFRAQDRLKVVVKRGGREEPFDREKLADAVRRACRAAGKDDVLAPVQIVPEAIARLIVKRRRPGGGRTTSRAILDAVWEVMREVEADPLRSSLFSGIREVWETRDADRHGARAVIPVEEAVRVRAKPLRVRIDAGKSHTTIWGVNVKRLADLPREPRRLFNEICRVEGIADIRLTLMSTGPGRSEDGARAEILASRQPTIIEGKCHHGGPSGQVQMFQIRVHDASRKEAIRRRLIEHLGERKLLRVGGTSQE